MGIGLECVIMDDRMAKQVFPLVRAHDPDCTLKAWLTEVKRYAKAQMGAIVALRGIYARGMLLYKVTSAAERADAVRVFQVNAIIVSDLIFGDDVTSALIMAARKRAAALGCDELRLPKDIPDKALKKIA